MLKGLRRFALIMTMCAGAASADSHPAAGQFELTSEFQWNLATFDDTYFALSGPGGLSTVGTRFNNDPQWQPGARATARYGFCGNKEVELDYTWLGFTQSRTIAGTDLSATVGPANFASPFDDYTGTASSSLDFLYQRGDAFYAQQIADCNGMNIYFKAGLEGTYLRLREDFLFATAVASGTLQQRNEIWGVGPEVGFSADFNLFGNGGGCPGGLSLVVTTTGSLLAGESNTSISAATTTTVTTLIADITDRETTRVIPAFHTRAGLHYDMSLGKFGLAMEIGYEFNSYIRALSRTLLPDDVADNLIVSQYYNYDIQGMYVNASVKF